MDIKNVAVVGSGHMGTQIAQVFAQSGFKVSIHDADEKMLARAKSWTQDNLKKQIEKGKIQPPGAEAVKANLYYTSNFQDAVKGADFLVEAVFEKLDVKRDVFRKADALCPAHTIFVSNSSNIVPSKMADSTQRQDRFANMHFFYPPLVMRLVEVVKGPATSEETAQTVMEISRKIGKEPILLKKECYGFVANRVYQALRREAFKVLEEGVASFEDIDKAMELGYNLPMGPFRLADLSGIDLGYMIMTERYKESGDPQYKPPKIIEEMYKRGEFGVKTGKGFYTYNK